MKSLPTKTLSTRDTKMADAILRSGDLVGIMTAFQDGAWEELHREIQAWQDLFRETNPLKLWHNFELATTYRLRSLKDPRFVLHRAVATKRPVEFVRRIMKFYPDRVTPDLFVLSAEHMNFTDFMQIYRDAQALGIDIPDDPLTKA
ncbi:unnamed protein product [Aphanomyces euteiches]